MPNLRTRASGIILDALKPFGYPHIAEEQIISELPNLYRKLEDAGIISEMKELGKPFDYASFENTVITVLNTYRMFGTIPVSD